MKGVPFRAKVVGRVHKSVFPEELHLLGDRETVGELFLFFFK